MKRLVIGAVVIVVAAGLWFAFQGPEYSPLEFYGTIEARQIRVGSLVSGRVAEVLVEEGDSVSEGEVLVRLSGSLLEPQMKEQEARVDEARAALDRVTTGPRREEINRARIAWERAEKDRVRIQGMLAQNLGSQKEYDDAAAAAESAKESYEELQRGSRSEDERMASSQVLEAEQRLAFLKEQLAETEVKAPAHGLVEALDLRPGDIVAANSPMALILEPTQLWVRFYVPETMLGRVQVGQRAHCKIDTFSDREFSGHVSDIRDYAEYTPRNVQTRDLREYQVFAVKLLLDPAPELRPGMSATVNLEAAAGAAEASTD